MPTTIVGATGINKIQDGTVVDADIDTLAASKLTGALPALNGANLTSLTAANIAGALPAISGANLTNLPVQTTDISGKLNLAGGAMTGLLSNTLNVARNANQIRSNATNLLIENTHASGAAGLRFKGGNGEASIIYGENNATDRLYFMPRNDTGKQVVIDHVGKVGIGTASPDETLDVEGTVQISRTSGYTANWKQTITHATSAYNGTLYFTGSTSTGGVVFQPNGSPTVSFPVAGGITFGTDTAAANALHDYEEGTWTPSFSGNIAFSTKMHFTYTKIGSIVHVTGYCNGASGTFGTSWSVSGLPYSSSGSYNMAPLWSHGIDLMYMMYMPSGSQSLNIRDRDGANMNSMSEISFQCTYLTNQ